VLDAMAREALKVPARVWQEMFAGLLQYDDRAELGRVAAPTLLIWGDTDGVVGREMQDELRARVPGAELVVYQGVGHTPRWEDPARYAADVTRFVERTRN
jgi:pimeloyl-ACP methyl ester carboxylesterase